MFLIEMKTNKTKLLRPFFLAGSTAFWLIMTSLLIYREFFQLTPLQNAYQVLPLQDWDLRQEYHAIYLGKERIGFNWNLIEKKGDDDYEFRHSSYLSFLFLGQAREMLIKQTAHLDRQLNIKDFQIKISSSGTWTEIQGQAAKDNLNVVIQNSGSEPVRKIFPVQGRLFFADALDFIWIPENLKLGKQGVFKTWNALGMSAQDVRFHVKRKEKILYDGRETEAFLVLLTIGELEVRSWISPEGIALQSESPTGLFYQKEEAWKIFDAMREKRSSPPDLPNLFSIPSNRILNNPLELTYMKARVQTTKEDKVVEIRRPDLAGVENKNAVPDPQEFSAYLQPTPFIQSGDPSIVLAAQDITRGAHSSVQKALKLNAWVHENIQPSPTVALPQAVEVLRNRKGDCNEYTVLYTALARAAGIPAKMMAGLVYQNGRFFYHAWPEVYLGEWIGIDPTFGQAPVDASHIPLIEGDLEEQVALSAQIGRIKVVIIETSEGENS
jgi:hypothetical protein